MIDPVAIQLGPISIRWYAICIVTGLVLAVYLAMKEAPRRKIIPDDILDFILVAFPVAIVGARLYYVAFEWDYYGKNLIKIIDFWNGGIAGIAIYGGLIAGAIVLYFFCRRRLIHPVDFLDIAAPSVMIAQSIGRWGNFAYRQPTFLYESVWNLIGFILIIVLRRRPKLLRQGEIAAFYLIWYGFGRMIIEGMRTDSLMFAGLRVSQWLSLILIFVGIGIIIYQRKMKAPYYQE